jgi:hypothetical protein
LKRAIRFTLLALVLAGGIWLWRVLFPGDEVVIRRRIQGLAEIASFPANEAPLAKVTNAEKVAGFFAVDGEIDVAPWGYQRVVISGRDELREAARGARFALTSLTVGVEAITIVLGPGEDQATTSFTLIGRTAGNPERQSQAMELEFRKVDGDWLIRRAKTVEYLSQ